MSHKQTGFTLIEILVVVVILGVLAAIAVPQYQRYVENGRRTAATACLMEVANYMERRYAQNLAYPNGAAATVWGEIRPAAAPGSRVACLGEVVATDFYTFGFSGDPTPTTFILQAVPRNTQANDRCGTLTLTQAGVRGQAANQTGCW